VVEHRYGALQNDRSVIVLIVREVHGAAADLGAVVQDRFVNARAVVSLAAERGNQGGMNIHHSAEIILGNLNQLQEAGQADEVGAGPAAQVENPPTELLQGAGNLAVDDLGGDPCSPRPLQSKRVGLVGYDQHHFGRQPAIADPV